MRELRELYNFTMKKDDDPVEKLYAMEDLRERLNNAGISVDDNNLYTCFVSAFPVAKYALEIRDLNLKQVCDCKGNHQTLFAANSRRLANGRARQTRLRWSEKRGVVKERRWKGTWGSGKV